MPHFHPLGVAEGDYLRTNASVLVACHITATCDTNWEHRFSHPRRSQGCQNVAYHLKRKRKTTGEFTYAVHTHTHAPRQHQIQEVFTPATWWSRDGEHAGNVECWEFHL